MHRLILLLGCLLLASRGSAASEEALYVPQAEVPTPGFNLKNTANFDDLRHNVLELIGGAKRRVWLLTDYLTDGDIVSALYLAKYRKVDVKVFLGYDKQNAYLSRLSYLKAQSIPVFTRPQHGYIAPTLIFVDQRLYTVSRDLNTLSRFGQAQIAQASPTDVRNFVNWFREVLEYPEAAVMKPEPTVGRASRSPRPRASEPTPAYQGESDGSFNYDRSSGARRGAPEGVSTKLPRVPRWKVIQEEREEAASEARPTPAPSTAPAPNPQVPNAPSGLAAPVDSLPAPRPGSDAGVQVNPPTEER
jgi:hypothetical protein